MTVPNRSHAGGAKPTALSGPMTNAAMTFTVTAGGGTGWPDGSGGDFIVCLDLGLAGEEKILCSARAVDTFTVAGSGRGYDGTVASAHANLAAVTHVFGAIEADELNDHVLASGATDPHPGYVQDAEITSMVTLSGTQTLSNKTLTTPTVGSFTNAQHDHANAAGGSKLAQANTHLSPDTDTGPTALHHTLGTGANQAAAGDHTHAGSAVPTLASGTVSGNNTSSVGGGSVSFGVTFASAPAVTIGARQSGVSIVITGKTTTGFTYDATWPANLSPEFDWIAI